MHDHVAGGFPLYVGDPEVYMQYRQCNQMNAAAEEKNAISILNELYYESAVYSIIEENEQGTGSCLTSVTVYGITAYGRGSSKKEAKLKAAHAAVEQLRCLGLLEQRMTEKEVFKKDRMKTASNTSASVKPAPYRQTVCPVTQENAAAKLNRLYGALNYNFIDEGTVGDFTVCVMVNDKNYTGSGRSKKLARIAAAEHALRGLNMWTAEDEAAKKQAQAAALVANQMSYSSVNVGNFRGRRPARGVRSRGIAVSHGRGLDHGQSAYGRWDETHEFPSTSYAESGHGTGASLCAKGSGKLSGGKKGGEKLAQRAAATAAEHMEMLIEKCGPISVLNQVYQTTEVYNYQNTGGDQTDEATENEILCTCTVSIDGVTGYGTGTLKKEAKRKAASSVVEQLKAAGILQKRLADKEAFKAQKHYFHAVRMEKRKKQLRKIESMRMRGITAQASRAPRAGRMQGGRGRSRRRRGRTAPMQGSRGRGVPGGTDGSDYYYLQSQSEFTTYSDFTTESDFMDYAASSAVQHELNAVQKKLFVESMTGSTTPQGSRTPRAGRMQGGHGRSTCIRGRTAPVQVSRGCGVPGGITESGGEGDSVAQPPVDDPRAGQSEGGLLEDTLLADFAIGSVQSTMSEATEEQADALLGHSDVEMAPVVVAPQLQQPKRPSGSERRRRKRQREAGSQSTGETVSDSVAVTPSQTGLPALAPLTAGTRLTDKAAFMAHELNAVQKKLFVESMTGSTTPQGSRTPRAGRMQGGRGRSTCSRGRTAPVQGSRGRGVPGGTDGSDYWYPQSDSEFTTYSDFTTQADFATQDNAFYRSFDDSTSKRANLTPSHFRVTANQCNRGRWLDFF